MRVSFAVARHSVVISTMDMVTTHHWVEEYLDGGSEPGGESEEEGGDPLCSEREGVDDSFDAKDRVVVGHLDGDAGRRGEREGEGKGGGGRERSR